MRRRDFIAGLAGAAAWPRVAQAQQPATPVVGFLFLGSPESSETIPTPLASSAPFRKGLSETGYVEGRNVEFEYRSAHGDPGRLPELASDLARRRVSVIMANYTAAALAAKAATATIPIVFAMGGDPIQTGVVASVSRPGGNMTGATTMAVEIGSKLLGLLYEIMPRATRVAVLINPSHPQDVESYVNDLQAAASASGRQIEILAARTSRDIAPAFASLAQSHADALVVSPDVFLLARRVQIVTLAARHGIVAIYPTRDWAEAGGLMSYGASLAWLGREVGVYTGRILKGEKPADLPILRPTKFEFVINRATAEALGLEVPATLLTIADEVIE
jgi:putative ABC transport system substrate-binding protein